jgi:hypothetical protein
MQEKLAEFLGHFAKITKRVLASLSVTAHTYFHEIGEVSELVNEWMSSSDFVQQEMGRRMKDKCNTSGVTGSLST